MTKHLIRLDKLSAIKFALSRNKRICLTRVWLERVQGILFRSIYCGSLSFPKYPGIWCNADDLPFKLSKNFGRAHLLLIIADNFGCYWLEKAEVIKWNVASGEPLKGLFEGFDWHASGLIKLISLNVSFLGNKIASLTLNSAWLTDGSRRKSRPRWVLKASVLALCSVLNASL